MKKVKFLLCISAFFLYSISMASIVVTKSGGGENGWYAVTETHENGHHWLSCTGEGITDCTWVAAPDIQGPSSALYDVDFLVGLAEHKIHNEKDIKGTILHNGEILIHWNGSFTSYTIEISIL
ncbi:MAG: hypothetical protein ACI8ZN_000223 [Bacteroidia bacterium]|jgi:hypothetical protein